MTPEAIIYDDWGLTGYAEAWERQERLFGEQLRRKLSGEPTQNRLVVVEHPHVYTLGKSGDAANLLVPEALLRQLGAQLYRVDRGGDITYHGPGQIVGYPILDLETLGLSLKGYIDALERGVMRYLAQEHGIESFQAAGATGVWTQTPAGPAKLCAIGTRASRHITMHGLALNINTDLSYFGHINPCGFRDRGATSVAALLGREVDFGAAKERLAAAIAAELGRPLARG